MQIAEESSECLLIQVVVFPTREIANVPLQADASGPGMTGGHHRLIQTDREDDGAYWMLSFLVERPRHLIFDPIALDGIRRENQGASPLLEVCSKIETRSRPS